MRQTGFKSPNSLPRLWYYEPTYLFYPKQLQLRIEALGFRVLWILKSKYHHLWEISLHSNREWPFWESVHWRDRVNWAKRRKIKFGMPASQLKWKMLNIVRDLGCPVQKECVIVVQKGRYFEVALLWQPGREVNYFPKALPAKEYPYPMSVGGN